MATLRDDIMALKRDVASILEHSRGAGSERISAAVAKAKEFAGSAKDKAAEAQKKAAELVVERPLTSVIVALAAGLVAGRLMGVLANRR